MCGRFTQERPSADLAELFEAPSLVDDPGGHFNVAPTQQARVVVERDGERRTTAYRWGLIPSWAPDATAGSKMFNARSETAPTSPAFREPFRRRRCIVPVDAFYEWRREGSSRQPYAIRRRDGAPLALAGLWSVWRDPATDEPCRSFAILTTSPNELMSGLHDRMPVILDRRSWPVWLDTAHTDIGELRGLLGPSPADDLEAFAVARLVNDVRNDGPDLMRPLAVDPDIPPSGSLGLA